MRMTDTAAVIEKYSSLPGGIAVLCGGPGGEREVSLESGRQTHASLIRSGVPARLAVLPAENPESFLRALDCSLAVMMLHGDFGEDGGAQAVLEERGVPFSGSGAAACRLSMDKSATKAVMRSLGLPTPASVLLAGDAAAERAAADAAERIAAAGLSYPLFVKPNAKGSSVGASRVARAEDLPAAVSAALAAGGDALAEELVSGRELTQGWLDGALLPLVEMSADGAFYDYRAKYQSDRTRYLCPAPVPAEAAARIGRDAAALVAALGMRDVARVDVFLRADGSHVFLEANALPGFTSHSLLPMAAAASGTGMDELCLSLVLMAAARGEAPV